MTIQRLDLAIPALNSQTVNLVLMDNGVPFNLTGFGVTFKAGPQPTTPATVLKTVGAGVTVTNAAGGAVSVAVSPTDFPDSGVQFWSLDVTQGGVPPTLQQRFFEGRIVITPSPAPPN